MRILVLHIVFILYVANLFGQSESVKVELNNGVDTSKTDIAAVFHLWNNYLHSNPDSIYDNPWWSVVDKARYRHFDFLHDANFNPGIYVLMNSFKPVVLSISETNSGYVIRTLFSSITDSGYASPACITEVLAVKEFDEFKLRNILPMNSAGWKKIVVGSITFIHPSGITFERSRADRMNRFVDSLSAVWNVQVKPVEYYYAETLEKVYKSIGLDFYMGEGNKRRPGGFANWYNDMVYAGGQNDWYPHEFVHIYINPLFPLANGYFLEGYATYLGGSKGNDLLWHVRRLHQYLYYHDSLNLNDLLSFRHMDDETDPTRTIGGLLCMIADEKGGLPAIKKLLSYGNTDVAFYNAIEVVFGVKKEGINVFIRQKIAEYSKR